MLKRLIRIIQRLRVEDPWTRDITSEELMDKYSEETFEVLDAVMNHDVENLEEELGDLLFHIVLLANLNDIEMDNVILGICNKMEKRHLKKGE